MNYKELWKKSGRGFTVNIEAGYNEELYLKTKLKHDALIRQRDALGDNLTLNDVDLVGHLLLEIERAGLLMGSMLNNKRRNEAPKERINIDEIWKGIQQGKWMEF